MRRAVLSFLLAASLLICASARAAAPTLLSLEQNCLQALETSTNLDEMANTWCGAFVSGYVTGFFYANAVILGERQGHPCTADWKIANKHIGSRICMPKIPLVKQSYRFNFYQIATALLALRVESLKENGTSVPVLSALRGAWSDPEYCALVATAVKEKTISLPPINPAFLNDVPLVKINERMNEKQSDYAACAQDIKDSGGSNATFRKTKCGAEMDGLLLGMTSVDYNIDKPAFSPACEKEIDRMYANLDTPKNFCIGKNTDALTAARAMIREIDRLPNGETFKHRSFVTLADKLPRFLCADNKKKPTGKKK